MKGSNNSTEFLGGALAPHPDTNRPTIHASIPVDDVLMVMFFSRDVSSRIRNIRSPSYLKESGSSTQVPIYPCNTSAVFGTKSNSGKAQVRLHLPTSPIAAPFPSTMKKTTIIGSRGVASAIRLAAFPAQRQLAQLLHIILVTSMIFCRRNQAFISAGGWKRVQYSDLLPVSASPVYTSHNPCTYHRYVEVLRSRLRGAVVLRRRGLCAAIAM
jgi:hypothetical protein